ncbi:precorrin-3B C(17)-methyltransferase [Aestuariivirga litoralis]|uniref:Precorrin-3B C(17)-methyltransferase n=1 Tax=Aestuariivirga litoralis TaxID=2650924 RepID=A0A2W2BLW6_9HYPH|nr:precorrin-3B C(17)-methyltransferase [Aestuariivirga litoralis]PZF76837.1 precorrin-3B C(17)-methyltransferase [Aestuariivirga litoralis]
MVKPVLLVLGASALPLAQKLKGPLDAEIHTPQCVSGGDVTYAKATAHFAQLFAQGRSIIGLCAAGIIIRAVAAQLHDKRSEPPVIALAEDGSSVVPLLGGHHGANELARRIAKLTGGYAAVTTASDVRFGFALDDPAPGFVLANPQEMKPATAALLNGAPLALEGTLNPFPAATYADGPDAVTLAVTEQRIEGAKTTLVYHPKTLVMGLGCERHAEASELIALAEKVLTDAGLSPASLAAVASIDLKSDEAAIHAVAMHFGVPARFFTADDLARETPRLRNPSEIVAKEVGVAGVAEAAALAAAGTSSDLIVEKTRSARGTCAIAKAPQPILDLPGQPRGIVHVVGIGPGTPDWRAPAARAALEASTDWVGYGLYLDLVADLSSGQQEHRFPLGGEEDRVRHAIELAKQGKEVALVCSGDAGIYAMAALVYEVIDLEPARIAVNVIPGISAFQAAAAKAGAMIGHDFCCISLSDLLTPWEAIEKRLHGAAEGDFVISFYNPRSLKRRDQLERAFAILKGHRPADTPVVIASNLGRPEEKVRIVRFADFNPDDVDMLTLVMVGSSQSKCFTRGDGRTYAYTPRGYARKREAAE